jgi:hypothetical protein
VQFDCWRTQALEPSCSLRSLKSKFGKKSCKLTSIGAESSPEASSYFPAGPGHLRSLLSGLETWLKARDFDSVTAIKGLMRPPLGAKARERVNYVESLLSYRGPDVRR